jgi:hypothetical protein
MEDSDETYPFLWPLFSPIEGARGWRMLIRPEATDQRPPATGEPDASVTRCERVRPAADPEAKSEASSEDRDRAVWQKGCTGALHTRGMDQKRRLFQRQEEIS